MFRFGFGSLLFAYILVPLMALFLWHAVRSRRRAVARFGNATLMERLSKTVSHRARLAKTVLLLVTTTMLVTALARPQFGTRVETVRREGQDIVVALDVSASMLAEDVVPNRLERAKQAVRSLIGMLEGDRIGLVAFAGQAFVQSPLTVDYGAAMMFLNAMDPDLIPTPGTDLGAAMQKSLDAFVAEDAQHRVLILITDGEDHLGDIGPQVERALEDGVRIHTVGIGSPDGVPIPAFDAAGRRRGFLRDDNGEVVTTRLDEATLEDISQRTGGRYYPAAAGQQGLELLADEIAGMEDRELDAQQFTQFEEQYQIFLGLALFLLTVELLVPERRRITAAWTGRFQ